MHPLVRDLLKRIALLKRSHYDPEYFMAAARRELALNKDLTDEREIQKKVAYGRWMLREEAGRLRFKAYRELRKRYGDDKS